jgi:hypothetical protein
MSTQNPHSRENESEQQSQQMWYAVQYTEATYAL